MEIGAVCIFPAYAGVNLIKLIKITNILNIPRVCGGEPVLED